MGIFDDGGWLDNLLPGGKVTLGETSAEHKARESRPAPSGARLPAGAPSPKWSPAADLAPKVAIPNPQPGQPAAGGGGTWLRDMFDAWNRTSQQQAASNQAIGAGLMGDTAGAEQATDRVLGLSPEGRAADERKATLDTASTDREQDSEERRRRQLVLEGSGERGYSTKELSGKAYGKLSTTQRAAVDFNTQLVAATKADQKLGQKDADVENAEYDQTLQRLFGERGESTTYAPNTVALLSQIDFQDSAADLDQFLDLQASVTEADLGRLTSSSARLQQGVPSEGRSVRGDNATGVATKSAAALSQALAAGQTLLQAASPTASRLGAGGGSGTVEDALAGAGTAATAPGFGSGKADAAVQALFEEMAKSNPDQPITETDLGSTFTLLKDEYGVAPEDFFRYADTRLRATEFGEVGDSKTRLGGDTAIDYKSPAQFRAEFGL